MSSELARLQTAVMQSQQAVQAQWEVTAAAAQELLNKVNELTTTLLQHNAQAAEENIRARAALKQRKGVHEGMVKAYKERINRMEGEASRLYMQIVRGQLKLERMGMERVFDSPTDLADVDQAIRALYNDFSNHRHTYNTLIPNQPQKTQLSNKPS